MKAVEVLLLSQQIKPDWVIIDERLARSVAFALDLLLLERKIASQNA